MMKKLIVADLFCGAGGASTGIAQAFDARGIEHKGYVINHWGVAIATHTANHPKDAHKCAPIETVIPSEFVTEGYLDLLWASPSCTHHSVAKGGKPRDNQMRAQPNLILDWLDMLFVKRIIVENVPEFVGWGPLNRWGKPIKSKKGECFRVWVEALKARNYSVEWRILNCADYGDCTTRKRFFLQAVRKGCGKINWPVPTHSRNPTETRLEKWRGIGECLDLGNLGTRISERKKPLAPATMRRIMAGLRKFYPNAFIIDFLGSNKPEEGSRLISPGSPLPTQPCANRFGVATPAVVVDYLKNGRAYGLGEPIPTQHCKDRFGIAQAFVAKWERNAKPIGLDEPMSTQTSSRKFTLCTPIILPQHAPARTRSADEPAPTICTAGAIGVAIPDFQGDVIVDVYFRMLTPDELKMATGFPKSYILTGNKSEQIKQIGNAVPVHTVSALVLAAFPEVA